MVEQFRLGYEFLISARIKEQDVSLPRLLSIACERAMRLARAELEGEGLSVPRQFRDWQEEGSNLPPVALIVRVNSTNPQVRQRVAQLIRRHLDAQREFAPYRTERIVLVTDEKGLTTYKKA